MEISETKETETVLDETNDFVDEQSPPAGDRHTYGYRVKVPEGYVVGIDEDTPVYPEIRDANGDPVDDSTRILVQGCDRQGNPLGDAIIFDEKAGSFDYAKMRSNEEYVRRTTDGILLDEFDILKVFVVTPDNANPMDAGQSRITIGDATADWGQPVEIVEHDALSANETAAVKQASQQKGR